MKLSAAALADFKTKGFVFLPELFSREEAALLLDEAKAIYATDREEVWRESSGVARTAFAAHTYNEAHRRLGAHPRLLDPVMQILEEQVYMHQYKINAKAAFDGDVWQWHQDYGTWRRDDEMPEARAMNLAVFLDEVNEFNAPLMIIPKSHKLGVLEAGHDLKTTSYPLWTLDNDKIAELVADGGIVAPKGPPGCGFFFHGTLVHGSTANMSPWDRLIVYVSYNNVDNHIRKFQRPEYIAHRDFTPLEALDDDCLLSI